MSFRTLTLARHFSTSPAVQAQLVKPPLAVFGIEGRYATALYSAATKSKKLEAVEADLKKFQSQLEKDKKLAEFVANPLINKTLKKQALTSALEKQKYNQLTVNLMGALAENGRMKNLPAVLNAFGRIMSAYRGEVVCEITTAKPLEAEIEKELKTALESFLKKGEVLFFQTKVDPSIIGGMLVSIGDKYVDMSIASKIKTYTNVLKEAV